MNQDLAYTLECVKQINPANLQYEDWLNVGLAIKNSGGEVSDWDNWSRSDSRYREHDCEKKWNTFTRDGIGVGTVVNLCKANGGTPPALATESKELDWNSTISFDGGNHSELKVVRAEWLDEKDLPPEPKDWNGCNDFIKYLEILFKPGDYVSIVAESYTTAPDKDGKTKEVPTKGFFHQTAKELIAGVKKHKELGAVIGDCKPDVGAWVRFNPLDGQGIHDTNVTDFKYALVESDEISINKQYSIYKELELPIAALVTSGKKSLHAIVKIDASDYNEYRNRVDYLYEVCKKNGLQIDQQNRNPSRLSRLPGVLRNGKPQRLVETNIGQHSWTDWKDWLEEQNDDLPDFQNLEDMLNNPPELKEVLIEGIVRRGHKMLISGPAKAAKSFSLMQLADAIAGGGKWLGRQCAKGDVLYINMELDNASYVDRAKNIRKAKGIDNSNARRVDVWPLRGRSTPLDKLAPKIIRRASKKNYIAIIIDPIYKVLTGDENSAEQMAKFCNQFDTICEQLNTTVIYCHHHSKGSQGNKRSADRASGSGVFARDPDALIDLIELSMSDDLKKQIDNQWTCDIVSKMMDEKSDDWRTVVPQDNQVVAHKLLEDVQINFNIAELNKVVDKVKEDVGNCSAWRVEGTLREFPSLKPIYCYFRYPIHQLDDVGILKDCLAAGEEESKEKKIVRAKKIRKNKNNETIKLFDKMAMEGFEVTIKDMMERLGVGKTQIYTRIKNTEGVLNHSKGIISRR